MCYMMAEYVSEWLGGPSVFGFCSTVLTAKYKLLRGKSYTIIFTILPNILQNHIRDIKFILSKYEKTKQLVFDSWHNQSVFVVVIVFLTLVRVEN